MTDETTTNETETGQHGEAPSPASVRWWTRLKTWWRTTAQTTNGNIVTSVAAAAVVLGVACWLIFGQIQAVSAKQLADTRHQALEAQYLADLIDHSRQVTEYGKCLSDASDRVDRSDGLRTVLTSFADLSDVLGGNALAEQYTKARDALIEAAFPALDVNVLQAACVKPGPEPIAPPT